MLLKTRFYLPPLRAGVIRRDVLLQQLQRSAGGSVVLVTAPAGYGKTTRISQWLHAHPQTFAWLTLGPEHNVIPVFWHYLLTALQQMVPELGKEAERLLLADATPDYQQVLITVLNDLDAFSINNRARDPLTLVLDDFHVLHNHRLLQLFNLLLDHLPGCIRIVITARSEPDLQLARRRASGQLQQLGIQELRFSHDECRDFFSNIVDAEAVSPLIASLCDRTEGWIAGLHLAALSLQRNPLDVQGLLTAPGLDKHIADYLLNEVFAALPGPLQAFLLQTAVVKRFCAGLCNAITARNDSQAALLELETLNLFLVPLDNHRTWFRYHDLFRQFLLQRLAQWDTPAQQAAVASALQWLEQNGDWKDAVDLALRWQCWPAAVQLLQQDAQQDTAPADQWQQWLEQLPAAQRSTLPRQPNTTAAGDVDSDDHHADSASLIEPLTRQEKTVLELIEQGLSNKDIARHLQISLNTLKVHIRNLYGKMGVENRRDILAKNTRK